jgi:ComEC/Rec2-related protein
MDDSQTRSSVRVDVWTVTPEGGTERQVTGQVLVSLPGVFPAGFHRGAGVSFQGRVRPPKTALVPGLFDYRAYLRRQGIHYQVFTQLLSDWELREPTPRPWSDRFQSWAMQTLARGLPVEDELLRLQWAMVLGWKTGLNNEVALPFMKSGTLHIFAISGLHIVLVAWIFVALLRFVSLPRAYCGLIAFPLLWFYTGATGWQPSAVRASLMMSVVVGTWVLNRPGNLINSLFAAAFIVLAWNSQQLFQASFQLSFFVVLGLALLQSPLERHWKWLQRPDEFLPDDTPPNVVQTIGRHLLKNLSVSASAWAASLPLIAFYFSMVTPVSLLANLVIVPLSSLALMCGLGSLCGAGVPGASELFNHAGWGCMKAMVEISRWMADWPGAWFYVERPSRAAMLCFYLVLVAWSSGWFCLARWRWWVVASASGLLLFAAVPLLTGWSGLTLHILPLPGAHVIVAGTRWRPAAWLVDCGDAQSTRHVTVPFLRLLGCNQPPRTWLTHGDVRHMGGARELRQDYPTVQFLLNPAQFRSPAWRQLREETGRKQFVAPGDHLGPWQVLHPDPTEALPLADDKALVLLAHFQGVGVLLLSDLSPQGQHALLNRHPDLRVDIVIVGRPSTGESLSPTLVAALQARWVVLADGAQYLVPSKQSVSNGLRAHGVTVFETRINGALSVKLAPGGPVWTWSIPPMTGAAQHPELTEEADLEGDRER